MGLKSVSEAFYTYLIGQTDFNSVLGQELYPFMATEGKEFPLGTYRVQRSELSVDGDLYDIALFLWFENYDDCLVLTDALTELFKNSKVYHWKLSDVDYDAELKLFNGIINIQTT